MTGDDLIYVEPRQEATLQYDGVAVACRTVPDAWIHWAQLETDEKERATIHVGDNVYDMAAIRRLRYEAPKEASADEPLLDEPLFDEAAFSEQVLDEPLYDAA